MKKYFLFLFLFALSKNVFCDYRQSLKVLSQNFISAELDEYFKEKNKEFQGCAQGSLIKTSSGYVLIENLQKGDAISSIGGDQEIIDIRKATLDQIVCVQTNGNIVFVSKNEQFFLQDGSLKSAYSLEVGDYLHDNRYVDSIVTVNESCDCYALTTQHHGYFIHPGIYVHNFDVAILINPSLLIGALEMVNPVTLLIGVIVPLSIYIVDYYKKYKAYDLNDIIIDDLQVALQDLQSVQQTRNYYEQKRKELHNLYQDLVSIYNGLTLLLKSNYNLLTFSNSWSSLFQVNSYNLLPLPSLAVECGYSIDEKQSLFMIRDQELHDLEVKIIDLEVVLAFHLNELIERRDSALKDLNLFIDEVNMQVNMWNFNLYNISNNVAISNYEVHLKELELLHNLEQKTNEVSCIVTYYDRLINNKILSASTNISNVIVNQLQLNKSVKDRIAFLQSIIFFNLHIYEKFLRERSLLSVHDIHAIRSMAKKEIDDKDIASLLQAKKKKESMKDAQNNLISKNNKNSRNDSDPDKDPLPEDNRSMMMHIFRKIEGHLLDTLENREALRNLVKDSNNYLGRDTRFLRHWYAKITKEGKQFWAWMQNGKIRDGGLNNKPLMWNAETGLCSPIIPKR